MTAHGSIPRALAQGDIAAWYQPVVDLELGTVVGLEALARWVRRGSPVLAPRDFIRAAEHGDLIVELDHHVIRWALGDFASLLGGELAQSLHVNLSGRSLERDDCADRIIDALALVGVPAGNLVLELSESRHPRDVVRSAATLQRLREHGCRVWFDDFGSGWLALQQLLTLPVDGVKLDWTFSGALRTKLGDEVFREVAHSAHELGLTVAIEGVESTAQAARARELGCDVGQGFLWGAARPMTEIGRQVGCFAPGGVTAGRS